MKIGFVTSSLSSEGGWGRYSKSLVESVAKHVDVAVITHKDTQNESDLDEVFAELPRFSFHPKVQLATYKSCMKHFQGCDLIHSLVEPFAPGVAFASKKLKAKFLMTLHGTYAVPPPQWHSVQRHLLRYALRSTHMSTTGSPYTEEKAREQVQFGECRFIPNGVDDQLFRRLSDAQTKPFILTTGAVKPRKGADLGVKALGLLKDEFPDLTYKVVGDPGHTKFVDQLHASAKELGVEDRIEVLGFISDEEIVRLYNECSAYVLAARDSGGQFEGFPMVFYEANACGAPVITTRGFGSEYAIKDGENGFLIDSEDYQAIADTVRIILSDDQLRDRMVQRGLEEAASHTWDKIAENHLLKMYHDTLQQS